MTTVSVWSALGQGSLHGDMDALRVSESSPSALEGWFVGGSARGRLYQKTLKAVMVLLAGPVLSALSKQPDLSCAPIAGCLSSPATGEWFQPSDPHSAGTGL